MLVREEPATELVIATRILARAGSLPDTGHVTLRAGEVLYVPARGASNHSLTPYDVVVVRIRDGDVLLGEAPADVGAYLARYRTDPRVGSVIATPAGLIDAPTLRACAVRALGEPARGDAIEATWRRLVREARVAGALIGAFPVGLEG